MNQPKNKIILVDTMPNPTNSHYLNALQQALFLQNQNPYTAPDLPTLLLQEHSNNDKYMCLQCRDCFYHQRSLEEHTSRTSWILGYWCIDCFKECEHSTENKRCCNSKCVKLQSQKLKSLQSRGLKNDQKPGIVRIFFNPCQLSEHMQLHSSESISTNQLMLLPFPCEIPKEYYPHLKMISEALMDFMFIQNTHIANWLEQNSIHKWWRMAKGDNPVAHIIKHYPYEMEQIRQLLKLTNKKNLLNQCSTENVNNFEDNNSVNKTETSKNLVISLTDNSNASELSNTKKSLSSSGNNVLLNSDLTLVESNYRKNSNDVNDEPCSTTRTNEIPITSITSSPPDKNDSNSNISLEKTEIIIKKFSKFKSCDKKNFLSDENLSMPDFNVNGDELNSRVITIRSDKYSTLTSIIKKFPQIAQKIANKKILFVRKKIKCIDTLNTEKPNNHRSQISILKPQIVDKIKKKKLTTLKKYQSCKFLKLQDFKYGYKISTQRSTSKKVSVNVVNQAKVDTQIVEKCPPIADVTKIIDLISVLCKKQINSYHSIMLNSCFAYPENKERNFFNCETIHSVLDKRNGRNKLTSERLYLKNQLTSAEVSKSKNIEICCLNKGKNRINIFLNPSSTNKIFSYLGHSNKIQILQPVTHLKKLIKIFNFTDQTLNIDHIKHVNIKKNISTIFDLSLNSTQKNDFFLPLDQKSGNSCFIKNDIFQLTEFFNDKLLYSLFYDFISLMLQILEENKAQCHSLMKFCQENSYDCLECNKKFPSILDLNIHLWTECFRSLVRRFMRYNFYDTNGSVFLNWIQYNFLKVQSSKRSISNVLKTILEYALYIKNDVKEVYPEIKLEDSRKVTCKKDNSKLTAEFCDYVVKNDNCIEAFMNYYNNISSSISGSFISEIDVKIQLYQLYSIKLSIMIESDALNGIFHRNKVAELVKNKISLKTKTNNLKIESMLDVIFEDNLSTTKKLSRSIRKFYNFKSILSNLRKNRFNYQRMKNTPHLSGLEINEDFSMKNNFLTNKKANTTLCNNFDDSSNFLKLLEGNSALMRNQSSNNSIENLSQAVGKNKNENIELESKFDNGKKSIACEKSNYLLKNKSKEIEIVVSNSNHQNTVQYNAISTQKETTSDTLVRNFTFEKFENETLSKISSNKSGISNNKKIDTNIDVLVLKNEINAKNNFNEFRSKIDDPKKLKISCSRGKRKSFDTLEDKNPSAKKMLNPSNLTYLEKNCTELKLNDYAIDRINDGYKTNELDGEMEKPAHDLYSTLNYDENIDLIKNKSLLDENKCQENTDFIYLKQKSTNLDQESLAQSNVNPDNINLNLAENVEIFKNQVNLSTARMDDSSIITNISSQPSSKTKEKIFFDLKNVEFQLRTVENDLNKNSEVESSKLKRNIKENKDFTKLIESKQEAILRNDRSLQFKNKQDVSSLSQMKHWLPNINTETSMIEPVEVKSTDVKQKKCPANSQLSESVFVMKNNRAITDILPNEFVIEKQLVLKNGANDEKKRSNFRENETKSVTSNDSNSQMTGNYSVADIRSSFSEVEKNDNQGNFDTDIIDETYEKNNLNQHFKKVENVELICSNENLSESDSTSINNHSDWEVLEKNVLNHDFLKVTLKKKSKKTEDIIINNNKNENENSNNKKANEEIEKQFVELIKQNEDVSANTQTENIVELNSDINYETINLDNLNKNIKLNEDNVNLQKSLQKDYFISEKNNGKESGLISRTVNHKNKIDKEAKIQLSREIITSNNSTPENQSLATCRKDLRIVLRLSPRKRKASFKSNDKSNNFKNEIKKCKIKSNVRVEDSERVKLKTMKRNYSNSKNLENDNDVSSENITINKKIMIKKGSIRKNRSINDEVEKRTKTSINSSLLKISTQQSINEESEKLETLNSKNSEDHFSFKTPTKNKIGFYNNISTRHEIYKFKCHLCRDAINTSWITLRDHFEKKHSFDYELCTIGPKLIRCTKYSSKIIDKKIKKLISSKIVPVNKKKKEKTDIPHKMSEVFVQLESIKDYGNQYKCKKCEKRFNTSVELQQHVSKDHQITNKNLVCSECDQKFSVLSNYEMHLKVSHGKALSFINRYQNCKPGITDFENNAKISSNQCYICMAFFESKRAVKKHLRDHGIKFLYKKKFEEMGTSKIFFKK